MIAGYPLAAEAGFLYRAVQTVQQSYQSKLTLEIVPLGGFPAARARKHFAKKALSQQPDIVVLQFGSTDASAPLRRAVGLRHLLRKDPRVRDQVFNRPASSKDLLKWHLRSLASELLFVTPNAPMGEYLDAVVGMVNEARAAGCTVVVLSPFIIGGGRSNRFARRYTDALAQQLRPLSDVFFLDAHALLTPFARREILLYDSFHLSDRGHAELGNALARLLPQVAEHHVNRRREQAAVQAA